MQLSRRTCEIPGHIGSIGFVPHNWMMIRPDEVECGVLEDEKQMSDMFGPSEKEDSIFIRAALYPDGMWGLL